MIKTASYSRLTDYESCALRAHMKFVQRLAVSAGPAAERGTAIHTLAEEYVMGKHKTLPAPLSKFKDEFAELRSMYKDKKVSVEGEWGFDDEWIPTDYAAAYLRIKADAVVHVTKTHARVIDYKTGKSSGNEIKHGEQVQLYAIATLIRHPELKKITVELWYLDEGLRKPAIYTRGEALRYVQSFDKRFKKMTTSTTFPANPTAQTCKWCDFGPNKGKQCPYGVKDGQSSLKAYRAKFG